MVLTLINEKDCVGKGSSGRHKGQIIGNIKIGRKRGIVPKKIDHRDRESCHNCGQRVGSWHEQFLKGRQIYRFLCKSCINSIENIK